MSDDFKAGDAVSCISVTPARSGYQGPSDLKVGGIYRVETMFYDPDWGACVTLRGIDADTINNAFLASRFRKLPPAEPDFIKLMRGLKAPTKIREDA